MMLVLRVIGALVLALFGWWSFDSFLHTLRIIIERPTTPIEHRGPNIPKAIIALVGTLILAGVCWGLAFILLRPLLKLIGVL